LINRPKNGQFLIYGECAKGNGLGPVDKDLERLIFGCDFLVLLPQGTPSKQMQ
jgi:hypothetical protein